MEQQVDNGLKECALKLKEAAHALVVAHHKVKNIPEMRETARDIADTLANVSSLALILQGAIR